MSSINDKRMEALRSNIPGARLRYLRDGIMPKIDPDRYDQCSFDGPRKCMYGHAADDATFQSLGLVDCYAASSRGPIFFGISLSQYWYLFGAGDEVGHGPHKGQSGYNFAVERLNTVINRIEASAT